MLKWILALAFICFSSSASAAPSVSPIYASLSGKFGYGKVSSKDKSSVAPRAMLVPSFEGVLAWQLSYLILGLNAEYAWWQQLKKPSALADSNLQGTMLTITPTFGLGGQAFRILVRYHPLAAGYDLARPSRTGEAQSYSSASQLGIQLHFQMWGKSFLGIEYVKTEFAKRSANGQEYLLLAGGEVEFTNTGVMYVVKF